MKAGKKTGLSKAYFPKASHPLEFVAFFNFEVNVQGKPAYAFLAVDAYDGYAFSLGAAMDESESTVLHSIFKLTEDQEFVFRNKKGFTLILDKFADQISDILPLIVSIGGKIKEDPIFNKFLALPVLESFSKYKSL
jgi:hypothetical protein